MQILSKHITKSGGLSFVWEDHNGYQIAGLSIQEVRKFLYQEGLISNRIDDMVLAKRRSVFTGISFYWVNYLEFLAAKLPQRSFCEKILSTNTILK